jgi:hypothetical protein
MRTIYTMKVRLQIYVMYKIKPSVFRYHSIKQQGKLFPFIRMVKVKSPLKQVTNA